MCFSVQGNDTALVDEKKGGDWRLPPDFLVAARCDYPPIKISQCPCVLVSKSPVVPACIVAPLESVVSGALYAPLKRTGA